MKGKEKFVMTVKLLEDNSGKKMGKTEGNMIALSDSPVDMFGKVMSWTDGMIVPGFELCTDVSTEDIEKIAKDISSESVNPRDLKMRLAKEVLTLFFDKKTATEAQSNWESTFSKKEIPVGIEEIIVKNGTLLVDALLDKKIISSKSDFRRLVDEKAITNLETNEKVLSHTEEAIGGVYRVGKKRFCKIKISE
jgi:tyrosyl-tRNA synthetase